MAIISVETPNGVVQVEIAGDTPTAQEAQQIRSAFFSEGGDVAVQSYDDMGFIQREIEDYKQIGRQVGQAVGNWYEGASEEVSDIAALPTTGEKVSAGMDVVNRGLVATTLGAPVDIADLVVGGIYSGVDYLADDRLADYQFGQAFGGSESIGRGMENIGMVSETRRPNLELGAALAPALITGGAAVAPKVATGVVKGAQATARGAQAVAQSPITKNVAGLTGDAVDAVSVATTGIPPVRTIRTAKGALDVARGKVEGAEEIGGYLGRRAGGKIFGGLGETMGRKAGQVLSKTDEAVPTPTPTAPVKPTAPAPVASIEESITRSRSVLGETAADDAVNAAAVETRAQGIIANAKEQGVVIPKKTAQAQSQNELDTIVARQADEARAARQAESNARLAKEKAEKEAAEAAFRTENAAHIKAVDDAIEQYPDLAKNVDVARGGIATRSTQRDDWYRNPEAFNKALQDAIEAPARKAATKARAQEIVAQTGQKSDPNDILAAIRARGSQQAETPTAPVVPATRVETPAQTTNLQRVREGLKRDDQRLADEETLTGMAPDMPVAVPEELASVGSVKPTITKPTNLRETSTYYDDLLDEVDNALRNGERDLSRFRERLVDIPKKPVVKSSRFDDDDNTIKTLEKLKTDLAFSGATNNRKLIEEAIENPALARKRVADIDAEAQKTANRSAGAAKAQATRKTSREQARPYVNIIKGSGKKKASLDMNALRKVESDYGIALDMDTLPNVASIKPSKRQATIEEWLGKQIRGREKLETPATSQNPFNLLFGE